jgi:hypothetical protein
LIFLVFFIARLTTSNALWFMRGSGVATFIMEAGLLGALIVAVLAQLAPQIVASKFPVQFMQCRGMNSALRVCLFLEATGIAHATWLIAYAWIRLAGWRDPPNINEAAISNVAEVRVTAYEFNYSPQPLRKTPEPYNSTNPYPYP